MQSNSSTIVAQLLIDSFFTITQQQLDNHSEKLENALKSPLFLLEKAPKRPKKPFFRIFFGKTLASFKKSSYFCIAIGSWCNGNTTGFGSVILGSNPGDPTKCADWLRYRR